MTYLKFIGSLWSDPNRIRDISDDNAKWLLNTGLWAEPSEEEVVQFEAYTAEQARRAKIIKVLIPCKNCKDKEAKALALAASLVLATSETASSEEASHEVIAEPFIEIVQEEDPPPLDAVEIEPTIFIDEQPPDS